MARESNLDEPAVFRIPDNFISKGTILGGMFKVRNAVEALIIVLAIGYPLYLIPMTLTLKAVLIILLCAPLGIIALIGVNRGPLSEFLLDFYKHKKLTHEYRYMSVSNNTNKEGENSYEKK